MGYSDWAKRMMDGSRKQTHQDCVNKSELIELLTENVLAGYISPEAMIDFTKHFDISFGEIVDAKIKAKAERIKESD